VGLAGHAVIDGERVSFVGRMLPDRFVCRAVTIEPNTERLYDAAEWAGAVIVVEEGELELECRSGTRSQFASGSVLFFESLPLRTLRNPGDAPVLLTAVSRR
jgi:hypothetical protein